MKTIEYENIYKNENTHFFYVSLHRLISSLIEKYVKGKRGLKILDAGCGTGFIAKKFEKYGEVEAIDYSPFAVSLAKRRGLKAKVASVNKLPFEDKNFDVIACIDVIYHSSIKDDAQALQELKRVLKDGGILILRVQANKWLKLSHDKITLSRQRYSKAELNQKLENAGFKVLKSSYVNATLLPLAIIKSVLEKLSPQKEESVIQKVNPFANKLLLSVTTLENKLLNYSDLPFGQGLIAVCQRP